MRSSATGCAIAVAALLATLASSARAQTFNPGDVFWAGSFTPAQLLNVTGGGNFSGVPPLTMLAGRSIGQLAWNPSRSTLYVTLFAIDRVDAITTTGMQSTFATGLSGPTGLLTTRDGRLLVANFSAGNVIDITAGGDFAAAPAFATGLAGPRNMVQLDDDRILIATQTNGRVIDITAGGNFGADPGFAFGLSSPVDLVQDAGGTIFVSEASASQVTDITAGGDFTGDPPFAFGRQFAGLAIDGSARLLANTLGGTNAWDITSGGNFAAVAPWAFNLPTAETAFDAVPALVCGDGTLDPMEQCDDGNNVGGDCCSASCTFESAGAPCPDEGQPCTLDQCDGAGLCTHPISGAGAPCRPVAGTCDLAETCDGISPTCPPDVVRMMGFVCRAVAGDCDMAETCNGVSAACPIDGFLTSGTCRPAVDLCDAAESCTGASPTCPGDALLPNGSPCRAATDDCDAVETCNGVVTSCPADGVLPAGTVCRPGTDLCDAAEQCDGASIACPPDAAAPDGTSCSDGAFCNGAEQCQGGDCGAGIAPCPSFCDENGDACVTGCPSGPQPCRTSTKSFVLMRRGADPAKHKLLWKWTKGAATTLDDLGNPTATTDYALCLYTGTPAMLQAGGELEVPADASRWSEVRTGYQYKDSTASVNGAQRIKLRADVQNKSKVFVKGKGDALPDPTLPIADPDLPLIVQLLNSSTTACWQSTFGSASVITNADDLFKARTP